MSLSIGERILIPGIGVALFAAMSRSFMGAADGSTRRMKTVLLCTILFMTVFGYSVFWQDKLAEIFGWKDVWKVIIGHMCCRRDLSLQNAFSATGNGQRF